MNPTCFTDTNKNEKIDNIWVPCDILKSKSFKHEINIPICSCFIACFNS